MSHIPRREFLKKCSLALLVTGTVPPPAAWAESSPSIPGKDGMIVRSLRFLDLEMPASGFASWITPIPHFFVRNHMHMPATLEGATYELTIAGEVSRAVKLTLADLQRLPQHTVINTLECAGNGRGFQRPQVPGVQWQRGAVGTARYSGPRMKDVLEKAGIKPTSRHVAFRGLDEVPGKVPPFIRSIPLEKAMHPDTLLATHMNGVRLPRYHGYPVRALVPGWIGAASTKWLSEITVLDKEFEGNFMKPAYRMPRHPVEPGGDVRVEDTDPIMALGVKSVITSVEDGAKVRGPLHLRGAAWAGEAGVHRVEISTDGGASWQDAKLGTEHARYAWRLWSFDWKPLKPGEYEIQSRATDDQGRTQPEAAFWNPGGYLYNAYDRVRVYVRS